jgi:3-deoxy-D-manno-octulosonic-acid transferase
MLELLYRGLTHLAGPAVRRLLDRRALRGKEDAARRGERLGCPARPRPEGRLIWVHAASVGESLAVLPLVDRLLALDAACQVLVTTGTVTSADLMAKRLPGPRAFHQYVPVDLPRAVDGFLDHWRPDLVLWIESEFWPNLLAGIRRRAIPCALVNARLSVASFRNWARVPGTARRLLSVFQLALAQTQVEAGYLTKLGVSDVRAVGNLKYSASPLPADTAEQERLASLLADRQVWCFASTHAGEEELAIVAQVQLRSSHPKALLVLVPRHPPRGDAVAGLLQAANLSVARRSRGEVPGPQTDIFLVDTLGELGLFFRLAPISVIGGSFVDIGGHNPIEPALLGSAVLYGPYMYNFAEIAAAMEQAGGAMPLTGPDAIAPAVARLLADPMQRRAQADAASAVAQSNAQAIDRVMEALIPLCRQAGIGR